MKLVIKGKNSTWFSNSNKHILKNRSKIKYLYMHIFEILLIKSSLNNSFI